MTKPSNSWTFLTVSAFVLCGGILLSSGGCQDRSRQRMASGIGTRKTDDTAFLVDAVAEGLNNLPREIVLELTPPKPILDDAKSADGQPVLATCNVTPAVPDGPYNYFFVPKGNAQFREVGVRPGDKLRYFANIDQEAAEHGYEQASYIELVVRRLDQFNPDNALIVEGGLNQPLEIPTRIEIWQFSDKRMTEINDRISRYALRGKTPIGWEPSADESALRLLIERANQWFRNIEAESEAWQAEPFVAQLPESARNSKPIAPLISEEKLSSGQFEPTEARQLQQAVWLRDISMWARGEAVSPVDVAMELFDWTIRNIQLNDPNDQQGYVHQPWQILMYGHGTAQQRAWIFAELCRQQQLDVVMLAADSKWWLPALLHEGQLYLFDTQLGLPIPGKDAKQVCTLAELKEDPSLLDQLSIEGEESYSITGDELGKITAELVATPLQLSRRALLLEQALEGEDYVVLSATTRRVGEELQKIAPVDEIALWTSPFQAILDESSMSKVERARAAARFYVFAQRPRLWKARILHFQGTKDVPVKQRNDPLAQPNRGHQQAVALYLNKRVRPTKADLERIEPSKRVLYEASKADASYWLGLLSYDLGKYNVAKDWLDRRTLQARPEGPWTQGARYNLARTYEAMGDLPAAIELLEEHDSPQRLGNLLRARRLKELTEAAAEKIEE